MSYFITFAFNFILAYFIYDDSGFLKPLIHSIFIVILVAGMDFILKVKRRNHSNEHTK